MQDEASGIALDERGRRVFMSHKAIGALSHGYLHEFSIADPANPKGVWRRHATNGFTSNALVPDTLTELGGGACFNDARVQVERLPDA